MIAKTVCAQPGKDLQAALLSLSFHILWLLFIRLYSVMTTFKKKGGTKQSSLDISEPSSSTLDHPPLNVPIPARRSCVRPTLRAARQAWIKSNSSTPCLGQISWQDNEQMMCPEMRYPELGEDPQRTSEKHSKVQDNEHMRCPELGHDPPRKSEKQSKVRKEQQQQLGDDPPRTSEGIGTIPPPPPPPPHRYGCYRLQQAQKTYKEVRKEQQQQQQKYDRQMRCPKHGDENNPKALRVRVNCSIS